MDRPTVRPAGLALCAAALCFPGSAWAQATEAHADTGDTAWMLISAALVLLMTPGLALFYGGMVRRKNVLATFMHSHFALGAGHACSGCSSATPWRSARRTAGSSAASTTCFLERRRRRPLTGTHPAPGLHGLPDEVRHHHPGADLRRVRRADEVQRLRRCSRCSGPRWSTTRSRTGSGRTAAGWPSSACSTSPAARSCT